MKRLGIFLIYDKQGIVDNYIDYLLDHMRETYSDLAIVCNCDLEPSSLARLNSFSKEVYCRENKGYDAGGFKDAICTLIGWERIRSYDELLLFNDSFFGPFFSLDEIFKKMENKPYDFWCMTKSMGNINVGSVAQSYFLVIRKKMLNSNDFYEYWEKLPYYSTFKEVVLEYEMKFAQYFSDRGYSWDSYIDAEKYDCIEDRKYRLSLYHTVSNELIREQGVPFLKRKLFDLDPFSVDYGLDKQTKENFLDALNYIKNDSDYDMKYIWKNVLRTYSLRNIQDNCCLHEMIDERNVCDGELNISMALWLYDQSDAADNIERFSKFGNKKNIRVGTNSKHLQKLLLEKYEISECFIYENERAFWENIFVDEQWSSSGDVLCFFNDRICDSDAEESYVAKKSYMWNRWENVFGKKNYISNIYNCFNTQNCLGLLVAPKVMHGKYIGNDYSAELNNELVELFQVKELINRSRFLADWSECFWIRGNIIDDDIRKKIIVALNKGYTFQDISKLMPYICQKNLYYTSVVESVEYSKAYSQMEAIYFRYFWDLLCGEKYKVPFGLLDKFLHLKSMYMDTIIDFSKRHKRIFIYGCGEVALLVLKLEKIDNLIGFIVSDNKNKRSYFEEKPVYSLSECEFIRGDGVVVALNDKNSSQVRESLLKILEEENVLFLKSGGLF